jgi:L-fuconolactonase
MVADVYAPLRFFDSHVHFWDPACGDWYPFLALDAPVSTVGLGAATGMKRRYDVAIYRADTASVRIDGIVHVTATRGPGNYVGETLRLGELHRAEGVPTAIVGGFNPSAPLAVIESEIDAQALVPQFVGVRTAEPVDYAAATTDSLLHLLADRNLVFDVMTHPDEMPLVAERLEAHHGMTFVIEHTGWPLSAEDPEHVQKWRTGLATLASSGPRVYCKLSGLAMTLHTFDPDVLRPWIEYAVEVFGVDRCLFGSNFPVDALFGDFTAMIHAYSSITAGLGVAARTKLFSANAREVYAPWTMTPAAGKNE